MGQTHDGGFVPMPGRDYASTDHVYATRVMPSAIAADSLGQERSLDHWSEQQQQPRPVRTKVGVRTPANCSPKADKPSRQPILG